MQEVWRLVSLLSIWALKLENVPVPRVYPENPQFKNKAEKQVFEAIFRDLGHDDVIFCNLEISDPQHGDVEIDLAVFVKNRGIAVIETKGGHISFDGKDWNQQDAKSSRIIFPGSQAKKNMYSLRDLLRSRWSQGNIRTDWLVAFPNYKNIEVGSTNLPTTKIIDAEDLQNPLAKILTELDNQVRFTQPYGDLWIKSAESILKPIASLDADFNEVLESNHQYIKDLTHERANLLDQMQENERYFVRGPAGSGKSWMAFEQAKLWTKEGKKVAMIAFNRGLVSYMEMKNNELKDAYKIDFVGTFHDFAKHIGTTAGSPSKYNEDDDEYGPSLIEAATKLDTDKRFDAIVVDEAQDFMSSWWECLRLSLHDVDHGCIAAFGDDQQRVFGQRKGPQWSHAKLRLRENIRNSQQIAKVASSLVEDSITARGPNSYEVEFVICPASQAVEKADDYVEQLTDRELWKPGEIALLTTKSRHPVHAEQADKDRLGYWKSLWDSEDVFYGTVGGFKGLERPVVILAIDGFHNAEDLEDFLYVGLTRARDKLVVIGETEILKKIQA